MHWESASAFFAMGGHGLWVWLAWGVVLAALVLEPLVTAASRRKLLQQIRRRAVAEGDFDDKKEEN